MVLSLLLAFAMTVAPIMSSYTVVVAALDTPATESAEELQDRDHTEQAQADEADDIADANDDQSVSGDAVQDNSDEQDVQVLPADDGQTVDATDPDEQPAEQKANA